MSKVVDNIEDINSIDSKAPLASPALTGTPTVNGVSFNGYSGFKNYIINGRFKVNQYGKLPYVAQSGSTVFIDGNWRCANSGTGTLTLSEDTITYGNTVYTAIKATATTAITLGTDTRYFVCTQSLEANNISEVSNKDMTLSFLFECSRAGKYSVSLSKQNSATGVIQKSYLTSFNATTGVQQVVIPITSESYQVLKSVNSGMFFHVGFVTNNAVSISASEGWQDGAKYMKSDALQWGDTAGAYIKYADVVLEPGLVKTESCDRPYGLELSLCQRYYQRTYSFDATIFWSGNTTSGSTYYVSNVFPVPMRVIPSMLILDSNYTNFDTIAITSSSNRGCRLEARATSTGNGMYVRAIYSASAEL